MLTLELSVDYDDPDAARSIYESLEPDNKGHLDSRLSGKCITFVLKADNAGTLRNTADDLLACIKIAEEASGLVSGTVADLDGDPFLE